MIIDLYVAYTHTDNTRTRSTSTTILYLYVQLIIPSIPCIANDGDKKTCLLDNTYIPDIPTLYFSKLLDYHMAGNIRTKNFRTSTSISSSYIFEVT